MESGDGVTIEVFNDPWLCENSGYFVQSMPLPGMEDLKVN